MPDNTNKINRYILWTTLVAIGLLAILSISAAFWPADRAKQFFNSTALAIFWYALAVLLLVALVGFSLSNRKTSVLIIHTGLFLVIAGSMWSSQAGHQLAEQLLGIKKIPIGYMIIPQNQSQNHVLSKNLTQQMGELPVDIKLKNFHCQYYQTEKDSASVRNYISEVAVIRNGKEVANKTIKVNYPLHYGGYHLYQHSYDSEEEKFTILMVTSDSGLYAVYTGYWLLCMGVFWQFWFRPLLKNKA